MSRCALYLRLVAAIDGLQVPKEGCWTKASLAMRRGLWHRLQSPCLKTFRLFKPVFAVNTEETSAIEQSDRFRSRELQLAAVTASGLSTCLKHQLQCTLLHTQAHECGSSRAIPVGIAMLIAAKRVADRT